MEFLFHIHLFLRIISELDKYRIGVFGEFPGVIVHISVAVTELVVLDSSFARIATVLIGDHLQVDSAEGRFLRVQWGLLYHL